MSVATLTNEQQVVSRYSKQSVKSKFRFLADNYAKLEFPSYEYRRFFIKYYINFCKFFFFQCYSFLFVLRNNRDLTALAEHIEMFF